MDMGEWSDSSEREGQGTLVYMLCSFFVDAMQLFCAPVPFYSIRTCTYFARMCLEVICVFKQPITWPALSPRQHCGTPNAGGEKADAGTGEAVDTWCPV